MHTPICHTHALTRVGAHLRGRRDGCRSRAPTGSSSLALLMLFCTFRPQAETAANVAALQGEIFRLTPPPMAALRAVCLVGERRFAPCRPGRRRGEKTMGGDMEGMRKPVCSPVVLCCGRAHDEGEDQVVSRLLMRSNRAGTSGWNSHWDLANTRRCCCAKSWSSRSAPPRRPSASTLFSPTRMRPMMKGRIRLQQAHALLLPPHLQQSWPLLLHQFLIAVREPVGV